MKKSLVLAMAMALGVTASAYAANPFSDVPAGHWAYDSISKLAAAGVIEGYGDTTFGGDKLMTRYEMAQIVAKAMAKGANCDKLAAEFADELDNLGVRVANLEKKADNVKISGETKLRYWAYDGESQVKNIKNSDKLQQRSRIFVKGQVNEDWSYTGMLENVQTYSESNGGEETVKFQRAYVNGKVGGVKVQAGRYHWGDFFDKMIYDTRMDGIQASYGKDINLTLGYGKAADGDGAWKAEDMAYAQLGTKIGVVDAKVGYYKFANVGSSDAVDAVVAKDEDGNIVGTVTPAKAAVEGTDREIFAAGIGLNVAKDLKFTGNYYNADVDNYNGDDDGFVVGLAYKGAKAATPGTWGVWAKYYDLGFGNYVASTAEFEYKYFTDATEGFKGYGVGVDYTFAKNIVGAVKYYDMEAKKGDLDDQTLYAELNFMF